MPVSWYLNVFFVPAETPLGSDLFKIFHLVCQLVGPCVIVSCFPICVYVLQVLSLT